LHGEFWQVAKPVNIAGADTSGTLEPACELEDSPPPQAANRKTRASAEARMSLRELAYIIMHLRIKKGSGSKQKWLEKYHSVKTAKARSRRPFDAH
jgi:hypothetical protein